MTGHHTAASIPGSMEHCYEHWEWGSRGDSLGMQVQHCGTCGVGGVCSGARCILDRCKFLFPPHLQQRWAVCPGERVKDEELQFDALRFCSAALLRFSDSVAGCVPRGVDCSLRALGKAPAPARCLPGTGSVSWRRGRRLPRTAAAPRVAGSHGGTSACKRCSSQSAVHPWQGLARRPGQGLARCMAHSCLNP